MTINSATTTTGLVATNNALTVINSYVSVKINTPGVCTAISTNPSFITLTNSYSDATLNCSASSRQVLLTAPGSPFQIVNNFYYLNGGYPAGFSNMNVTQFNDIMTLQSQVNSTFDQCNIWTSYRLRIEIGNNLIGNCTIPTTQIPSTTVPSTQIPSTQTPSTNTPSTQTPSTQTPSTIAPSTEIPSTQTPSTNTPSTTAPSTQIPSTPSTQIPSTQLPSTQIPSTETPSTQSPFTITPNTQISSTLIESTQIPSTSTPSTQQASNTQSPSTTQIICAYNVVNCLNCNNTNVPQYDPNLFNISCVQFGNDWVYIFKNASSNTVVLAESTSLNNTFFFDGNLNQTENSTLIFVVSSNKNGKLSVSGCASFNGNLTVLLEERPQDNSNYSLVTFNCNQTQSISDSQISISKNYKGAECDRIQSKPQTTQSSLSVSLSLSNSCKSTNIGLIIGLCIGIPIILVILTLGIIYIYKMKNKKLIEKYGYGNQMERMGEKK